MGHKITKCDRPSAVPPCTQLSRAVPSADRVVDGDRVVGEQFLVVVAVQHQIVDVDLAVFAPAAVDVARSVALAALGVARHAEAALRHGAVDQLEVTGRVNGRTVVDARTHFAHLQVDLPVPLADVALRTVCRTFLALRVAATTAFQLHTARPRITAYAL